MFCYDKVADRSHPITTEAAAQESYFYEIPPGSFENVNVPLNAVENALSAVEGAAAPLHAELIKCADRGRVPAALTLELGSSRGSWQGSKPPRRGRESA